LRECDLPGQRRHAYAARRAPGREAGHDARRHRADRRVPRPGRSAGVDRRLHRHFWLTWGGWAPMRDPVVPPTPDVLASLPIFPLPNCVLLPGGMLPLHVFEPRYREMTRDCLAGHQLMAVARLKP